MDRKKLTRLLAAGTAVFLSVVQILPLFSYADNALLEEENVEADEETIYEDESEDALGNPGQADLADFLWPDEEGKYSVTVDPATDGSEYCIYVLPGIYRSLAEIPFETAIRNLVYIDQKKASDGKVDFEGFTPSRQLNATVVIGTDDAAGGTRIVGYISRNIFRVAGYVADQDTKKELPSFVSTEPGKSFAEVKETLPAEGFAEVVSEYQDPVYVPVTFTWAENEEYDPEAKGSVFRFEAKAEGTDTSYPASFYRILAPYTVSVGITDGYEKFMKISASKTKVVYEKGAAFTTDDITVSGICYNGMVIPVTDFETDASAVSTETPGEYELTVSVVSGGETFTSKIPIRVEDTGASEYCTVSFDPRGGSPVAPLIVKKGETAELTAIPEKTGYTFERWYLDAAKTNPYTSAHTFMNDTVLYAGWIDDSAAALSSITVSLGFGTLKTGEYPDPSGFTVTAHYEDGSEKEVSDYLEDSDSVDYDTPGRKEIRFTYTENGITKNCTAAFMLYADTEEDLCTVSFDTGCDVLIPDMSAVKGDRITAPDAVLSKAEEKFLGWYLDGKEWNFVKDRVAGDMTLTAGWARQSVSTVDPQIFCYLSDPGDFEYTGKAIKPAIKVMDGNGRLLQKGDYTVTYRNNTKISAEADTAHIVVTGKGNYQGTVDVPFKITKRTISEESGVTITLKDQYDYKKNGYTPAPTVKYGKTKLKKEKDYTITYEKLKSPDSYSGTIVKAPLKEAGWYLVRVTGKGNFEGSDTRVIRIAPKGLTNLSKAYITIGKSGKTIAYKGEATNIDNEVTVWLKKKGNPLEYGTDYVLIYPEDTESAGTKTVIVRAASDSEKCYGEKKISYTVSGVKISKTTVKLKSSSVPYSGNRIEDQIESVKIKVTKANRAALQGAAGENLAVNSWYTLKDTDYTASYTDCVDAGTAVVTLKGQGAFTDSVKKKFKITKVSVGSAAMTCEVGNDIPQDKKGAKAEVRMVYATGDGNVTLTEGKDYTLKYSKNTAAGTKASVKISGKGNFSGSRTEKFTILAKSLRSSDIRVALTNPARKAGAGDGYVYKPSIAVYDNGALLKENKDYTVDLSLCVTEGMMKSGEEGGYVKILAKNGGSYTGENLIRYRVVARSLSDKACTITIADQVYTGSPVVFDLSDPADRAMFTAAYKTGENTSDALRPGKDFEIVSITKNLKAGTAVVTLRGLGDYSGTVKVNCKIGKQKLS